MKRSSAITRREFLGKSVLGLVVLSAATTVGCGGGEAPVCGATGLTPAETTMRTQVGYKDHSPDPTKACGRCQLFTAPAGGASCGTCALQLGAVGAEATCNSFVAKA